MSTAIILAGGLGTRLRSAVRGAPKPMALIDGKPFLQYQLDYWIAKGIDNFVFSVGYKHEVISDFFGEKYLGALITYSVEETPMGTGGGFLLALKMVAEDLVLLLNGDTFFDVDFEQLKALHVAKGAAVTFSMFKAFEAGRYMGMEVDSVGRVTSLATNNSEIGRLANGGVYLVKPSAVMGYQKTNPKKNSLEDDIFPQMLNNRAGLYGQPFDGKFIDIGIPSDYERAGQILCC